MKRIALLVTLLSCVCAGCGFRANPLLTSIVDAAGTTNLTYDDNSRVQGVDDGSRGLAFTYSADRVTGMTTTNEKPGVAAEPVATAFDFTGGQMTSSDTDFGHGNIVNVAVKYDGSGRISSVTTADTQDGQAESTTTIALTYGDEGLTAIHTTSNDGSETNVAVAYKAGNITSLTTTDANGQPLSIVAVAYKGGRLHTLTTVPTGQGARTTTFTYDKQNRITNATTKQDGADDDVISLGYGNGNAIEVDMTPAALFPVPLWDLEGASHNAFDPHTQVPRFAGASW